MKKALVLFSVLFLVLAFAFFSFVPPVKASVSGSWWDTNWTYRKEHNVTGSSLGNQTNYQMNVTVIYSAGSDSAWTVYVDGETQADFDDVRFTWFNQTSGSEQEIDYWLEDKTDSINATLWFEVPLIHNLTSSNNTVYMYYGNSTVSSASNGKNTFPYFYDFDTDESSEWTLVTGGWNWDTANGWLQLTGATESLAIITSSSASLKAFRSRVRPYRTSAQVGMAPSIVFAYTDSNNYYMSRIHEYDDEVQFYKKVSASFTKLAGVSTTINDKQWYLSEVKWLNASHIEVYTDGVEDIDQTTNLESWTTGAVGFRHYYSRSDFDWYLVRNLCDPEPTHGDWGPEEIGIDSIAPTFSEMGINQTYAGNATYFYCNVTDTAPLGATPGLSGSIFNSNNSGTYVNQSFRALSGTSATANDTLTLNNTVGVITAFRFYVNDTSNNWLTTAIFTFPTDENASGGVPSVGDGDVPFLSVFSINNTLAGNSTFIRVTWTHPNASKTLSHTVLETNNTGTPTNQSWKALSGTSDSANETLTLNSTVGTYVYLKWYCNDSVNGWAEETEVIVLTAQSGADNTGAFWFITTILCGVGILVVIPLAKKLG